MPTRDARAPDRSTVRHARNLRSHHLVRSVALTLTAVLAFGAGGLATAYSRFQGNIAAADVTDLLGTDRPTSSATHDPNDPNSGSPVTILLMGSDVRDGANGAIGGSVAGMRSDTTIVLHIAANRKRVELVSIPRDSHVQIPSCAMTNGTTSRPQSERFNAAFAIGADTGGDTASAAACAIKTVESLTGVRIDGFVVVDFVGFIRMVDALGGVPICIPNAMSSPKAGLTVNAGYQTLDGTTALAYARARTGTGVGDGSDTNRIGRQQELLAATAREVLSKNLLTDVGQLLGFLDAATSSVTADPELASIANLAGLAFSLKDIPSRNIVFLTVPFSSYAPDPNQVVWTSAAATIWANMASDRPVVPTTGRSGSTDAGTTPATPATSATLSGTADSTPSTAETKSAGEEAFTPDDITAVCG